VRRWQFADFALAGCHLGLKGSLNGEWHPQGPCFMITSCLRLGAGLSLPKGEDVLTMNHVGFPGADWLEPYAAMGAVSRSA